MRLPSHLRKSRHGVWCFRLVLPDVLAAALGQQEIRRSLGTRCPATAKLMAYRLSGKMIPILRETRRAMAFDPNSIDPSKVRELIVEGLVIDKRTGTLKADRIETSSDPEVAKRELATLEAMAGSRGWSPESQAYFDAERAYLQANAGLPRPTVGKPCTVGQGIEAFLKHKRNLAAGSLTTYTYRLNKLASLVGGPEKMLHEVSEEDCVDAAEKFSDLSPHESKRSQGKKGVGTVSAGTVKDTLILWQSFFSWAIRTKRYAGENPIKEIPRPSENNEEVGAEPFSPEELKKIFQPQVFAAMKRPHQFWAPLIGLFTGMRSNEVAQLRLMDFIEDDGVSCINITHDPRRGTRTKNAASKRKLPIHPTLWAIGLQDYLDDLKELGADRLFPNLPADKKTGKRERYLSRDFNEELLPKLGIHQPRTKVFHSFRDTVTGKLALGKINPAHIADWLGHAREGTESEHYIAKLTRPEQVQHILPLLVYGLDFSEFKYQRGRWNAWLRDHMVP